jgi:hypothetical protein
MDPRFPGGDGIPAGSHAPRGNRNADAPRPTLRQAGAVRRGAPRNRVPTLRVGTRVKACPSKVGRNALLGFAFLFQSDYYIPLLVPCVDIPVGLGSLFQRIASIYDRFYLAGLDKLFEENWIVSL